MISAPATADDDKRSRPSRVERGGTSWTATGIAISIAVAFCGPIVGRNSEELRLSNDAWTKPLALPRARLLVAGLCRSVVMLQLSIRTGPHPSFLQQSQDTSPQFDGRFQCGATSKRYRQEAP